MFFNPEFNSDAMYETTTDVNVWGGACTVYGGIKYFSINLNLRAPLMAIMSHPIKKYWLYIYTMSPWKPTLWSTHDRPVCPAMPWHWFQETG